MSEVNEHAERLRKISENLSYDGNPIATPLDDAADEIERLAARVAELEAKEVSDKVVDDITRRCLPKAAFEAMMLGRHWLLVKYDPQYDFVVEAVQPNNWR